VDLIISPDDAMTTHTTPGEAMHELEIAGTETLDAQEAREINGGIDYAAIAVQVWISTFYHIPYVGSSYGPDPRRKFE
jgi:hypothetical protein